jgi:hypothetical protein
MDYSSDSLSETLRTLDAQLSGPSPSRLAKNLEALEDRVDAHRAQDARTDWSHDQQLEELRAAIQDLRARHVSAETIRGMLSKM